jgi:hypothetical protein
VMRQSLLVWQTFSTFPSCSREYIIQLQIMN